MRIEIAEIAVASGVKHQIAVGLPGSGIEPPENMIQFQRHGKFHSFLPKTVPKTVQDHRTRRVFFIQRGILFRIKLCCLPTYFVYFKGGTTQSRERRPGEGKGNGVRGCPIKKRSGAIIRPAWTPVSL